MGRERIGTGSLYHEHRDCFNDFPTDGVYSHDKAEDDQDNHPSTATTMIALAYQPMLRDVLYTEIIGIKYISRDLAEKAQQ